MIANNYAAKAAAVVAGLGLVFAAIAPAASAQTTTTTTSSSSTMSSAQLQAQIAALLAQIQSLQAQLGTSSTGSMMFSTDLTLGSSGSSVTALQTWLISKGYSIPAGATGYFGAQTKAAVAAYQAANGISPAAGYFGPVTRAKVNASAGTTTTTTTTGGTTTTTTSGSTTLSGGEGSIDNFKVVGATNTTLNAADSDTVYGFEFKADGSDLQVNRVDYDLYNSNNVGSTHPWNLFQTAELWNGNTKVASQDISAQSDFSQDGTAANGNQIYRIRFDNLNNVVKQGSTVDYYLKLYTDTSISNSNVGAGAVYTVNLTPQGVRAVDAMGIQQYSSASTPTTATIAVSNSTTGTLTVSTGSDNPQTTTVMGNTNSSTSGIVLNTFTLQAKDSDLNIYSIPVRVATTSSSASNQIRSLKLYSGSTLLATQSVPAASGSASVATTTFTNLNIMIPQGTTQSFSIQAEINSIDGSSFQEGSSVTVSVPGYGIDAENSGGNIVTINGSSTGNTITFRTIGFSVDSTPSVASATANNNGANNASQTGTFTFTFNVTAFGQDVYLASTSARAFVGGVYDANGNATTTTSAAITSTADRTNDNNYVVHNGQTKQVTITLSHDNTGGVSGFYYARLTTLYYATSTATLYAGTEASLTFPNSYQTNQVNLHS